MAMPNGSATSVDTAATRCDSATAVQSWGDSSNTCRYCLRHRPDQEAKAVLFEDHLGGRRAQEAKILIHCGVLCPGGCGHRISDRRIRIVGKHADCLYLGFNLCVGLVNNSNRCFAAGDESKRCPHIFGLSKLRLGSSPGAELFKRCLGIDPGGDSFHIGDSDAAIACELGDVETLTDADTVKP